MNIGYYKEKGSHSECSQCCGHWYVLTSVNSDVFNAGNVSCIVFHGINVISAVYWG